MKNLILISFLFLSINISAQFKIIGKTYKAVISASCKEFNDGGTMIYTYCILKFEKKNVTVFYETEFESTRKGIDENSKKTDKGKAYKWIKIRNVITIKGFNDYGRLNILDEKLIGRKKMNYNEFKALKFDQQL